MTLLTPSEVSFDPRMLLGPPRTLLRSESVPETEEHARDGGETHSAPELDWECLETSRTSPEPTRRWRRRKMRPVVTQMALFALLVHYAQSCSETTTLVAKESECFKDKEGRITCTYSNALQAVASHETSELCLLL